MTLKHRFFRFTKTIYAMDLRPSVETRKSRCERFERKNKTVGKPSHYEVQ